MSITVTLFGQILTFIVLLLFVHKFLWDPLTQMMDTRNKRIADGLAAADRGSHELKLAEHRAASRLHDAKHDAADIITAASQRANEIIEEAKEQARIEGQRQIAIAVSEVEHEINRVKEDLRHHVVNLSISMAEKILEREIDKSSHDEFIAKMVKKL
ncbi:MAG: F0F1 ATP synthase subunit B [Thiomargarita sp.]|nr:F0F1 ATP synthase subunit B [Thiomargarita sp.]